MKNNKEKIILSDFFAGDNLSRIQNYIAQLQYFVDNYDLIILMARKAICFFDALVRNGQINLVNSKCKITTNRVFTYNLSSIKEKNIVVIDDIVVRGKTLNDTISQVEKYTKCFKIFYLANEKDSPNIKNILLDKRLITKPLELTKLEILTLSNCITNYIAASMCSYNIDYPVFSATVAEDEFVLIKEKLSCYEIKNSIQENFDIEVGVQSIGVKSNVKLFDIIDSNMSILKIRIFYDKFRNNNNLVLIPIALFEELSYEKMDETFRSCTNKEIEKMVKSTHYSYENKLKWVQFILSYYLFNAFIEQSDILLQNEIVYAEEKQNWIFPWYYNRGISELLQKNFSSEIFEMQRTNYTIFDMADVFAKFQHYIQKFHERDLMHNNHFTFNKVASECLLHEKEKSILSNVFDIAIDKGLIVPLTYADNTKKYVYRAYKLSEQYELTAKHLDLFVYMLKEYKNISNDGTNYLDKTIVEKLIVLFFNREVRALANSNKIENGNNFYNVHYTRFGPVISTGEERYEVVNGTELTDSISNTDNFDYSSLKYNYKKNKYEVPTYCNDNFDIEWKKKAYFFSEEIHTLEEMFKEIQKQNKNRNIKSFSKYLTLKAIGEKLDDKYLSLLAELRLFSNGYNKKKSNIDAYLYSLSGLISGAWKYICYKEESLKKIESEMGSILLKKEDRINEINEKLSFFQKMKNKIGFVRKNGFPANRTRNEIITNINRMNKIIKRNKIVAQSVYNSDTTIQELLKDEESTFNIYENYVLKAIIELTDEKLELISFVENNKNNFIRIIDNERDTCNKTMQINYENKIDQIAKLICELLQIWNQIKTFEQDEFEERLKNIEPKQNKEFDPNDSNLGYINQLLNLTLEHNKKYLDIFEINTRLQEICHEIDFLVDEYDKCIKQDLCSVLYKRLYIVINNHIQISKEFTSAQKDNYDLVKSLGLEKYKLKICAFTEQYDGAEKLLNMPYCTKIFFDFNKQYNNCVMNSNNVLVGKIFEQIANYMICNYHNSNKNFIVTDNLTFEENIIMSKENYNQEINIYNIDEETFAKYKENITINSVRNTETDNSYDDVSIAILTALPTEFAAVKMLLENPKVCRLKKLNTNEAGNRYYCGTIKSLENPEKKHRLILVLLPKMGNDFSSIISTKLQENIPSIKDIIICGIAGGVPQRVRLGDVVVSTEGIVEYDYGRNRDFGEFELKEESQECSLFLKEAVEYYKAQEILFGNQLMFHLERLTKNKQFARPQITQEAPYLKDINGKYSQLNRKVKTDISVHYGKIGSSNSVQRNPDKRDLLYERYGVYAIEMESGGVNHSTKLKGNGYLAIRSICDYCDESKNKEWQNYSAAVAAAYTIALIESIPITNLGK